MLPINRKKTVRRLSVAIATVLLATAALTGCGKDKEGAGSAAAGEVVATYKENGQVTRAEYDSFVNSVKFFNPMYAQFDTDPTFQDYMVKQLIGFKVLGAKADDQAKKDAEARTQEQMDQITQYFEQGGKDAFDNELKAANLTKNDIQDYILKSLIVLGNAEKNVTDENIKAAYDERAAQHMYTSATVSHILVSTMDEAREKEIRTKEEALKRAQEIKQQLDSGGDFATLAKEYTDDPGSKETGGKYEDVPVGQWTEGFKEAAAELPIGQISAPVETEFGYHIMRVETRTSSTLEQVKDDIKAELAEGEVSQFIDNELPALIENIDLAKLPQPAPTPATPPASGTTPSLTTPAQ